MQGPVKNEFQRDDQNKLPVRKIDISKADGWNDLVSDYRPQILRVLEKMAPLIASYKTMFNLGYQAYKLMGGVVLYEDEIEEIAHVLGISIMDCLLFQLTYELCSACTSSILTCDNKYVLARSMDWALPELKDITVQLEVYRGKTKLFEAVSWAGFVGIFTGIKIDKYAIALNYRRSNNPNFFQSLKAVFLGFYPAAFYIRELLSSDARPRECKRVKLIAPCYLTVLETDKIDHPMQCVVVRHRESFSIKPAPAVQTNCDDLGVGDNIMNSYERIKYMQKVIKDSNKFTLTLNVLVSHINTYPIYHEDTIYTTIMVPEGFLYVRV